MGTRAQVMAELERAVSIATVVISEEVVRALQPATPVDTGFAASNWIAKSGAPNPNPTGSREQVDHGAPETALAVLRDTHRAYAPVVIGNAVPYIRSLNAGHSPQAPPGFVQVAAQRGLDAARSRLSGRIVP